ncbi:MAG TPA: diguanylate cyclase [Vicinamibacteria bacterium]|nr:diguanylate cyclase [Vicinamibacteria bacterium]
MDYRKVLDGVADGVYFVDRERRITYWNRAAAEISGHKEANVLGIPCPDGGLEHVDAAGNRMCHAACPLTAVLQDGRPREEDAFLHHADGHRVPVHICVRPILSPTGEIVGAVETFTDTSVLLEAQRRSAELERLAFIDPLTGLANRRFAEHELASSVAERARHGRMFGVLLLDVDQFKRVNDEHGHQVGDAALSMLGRTLAGCARTDEFVARWGGEEFLVLIREYEMQRLRAAGERIRRMVAASTLSLGGGRTVALTVSIGGCLSRSDDSPADLLRRADALLYESKAAGRNRVTIAG